MTALVVAGAITGWVFLVSPVVGTPEALVADMPITRTIIGLSLIALGIILALGIYQRRMRIK